jgi:hypothetical protein
LVSCCMSASRVPTIAGSCAKSERCVKPFSTKCVVTAFALRVEESP